MDLHTHEYENPRVGVRDLNLALKADASFDEIVKSLEKVLTLPELPGVRGCAPCLSGLDRLVVQNAILPTLRF